MARRKRLAEVVRRIIDDPSLSSSAKLIYLSLAADHRLSPYGSPLQVGSYEDLSKVTGFSIPTVRKAVRSLVDVGLIEVVNRPWLEISILHLDQGYNLLRRIGNAGT